MFKRGITILILVLCLSSCDGLSFKLTKKLILEDKSVRKGTYKVDIEKKLEMLTRDGKVLKMDIYRPKELSKTPTILVRIPCTRNIKNGLFINLVGRFYAKRGYTVVVQGSRGKYGSKEPFYPLIPEREDGIDTLNWLKKQSWYDGRLAMWGGSAFGYTQWCLADQKEIDAFSIQIASSKFQDMFYIGNTFSLESALTWAIRSYNDADKKIKAKELNKYVHILPIDTIDDAITEDIDFYNDWSKHRPNDNYWQRIDGTDRAKQISAPTLLLAGWYDPFLQAQLEDFKQMKKARIIIGPWKHAIPVKLPHSKLKVSYRNASIIESLKHFDEQFFGIKNDLPKVRIFTIGKNEWRDENEWPLARTKYTSYYLSSTSTQSEFKYEPSNPVPSLGGASLGPSAGIRKLNKLDAREDILHFNLKTVETPLEITGPIKAILYVATSATSTDFTVRLVDVFPNGDSYNISDGVLRRSYKPNKIEEIVINLWATSYELAKGHTLRLDISSSNFPRFDRNTTAPAEQTILHSKTYPSRIILPEIDPS